MQQEQIKPIEIDLESKKYLVQQEPVTFTWENVTITKDQTSFACKIRNFFTCGKEDCFVNKKVIVNDGKVKI